jgi:GAF domain-containing protein
MTVLRRIAEDAAGPDGDVIEISDQLQFEFGELQALLGSSVGLDVVLRNVADFAVSVGPRVDGAVVRLVPSCSGRSAAAGSALTRAVDNLQYSVRQGPAWDAITSRSVVCCGSLGADERWAQFGPRAGRLGVHSALAVPLVVSDHVVGTVTAYSQDKLAFLAADVEVAERYSGVAGAVLHNAHALALGRRRIEQLTETLTARPVIDQAVGIVVARTGRSADEALAELRRMSNSERVDLADLARRVVEEARRKANRRRRPAPPD